MIQPEQKTKTGSQRCRWGDNLPLVA